MYIFITFQFFDKLNTNFTRKKLLNTQCKIQTTKIKRSGFKKVLFIIKLEY